MRKRRLPWQTRACLGGAVLVLAVGALATPPALQVTHGVGTGSMPKGVTLSPDGTRLYVTAFGAANAANVNEYDAADLRRLRSFDVPGIVVESAITPDGSTLYVSNFSRNSVQQLDLRRGRVVREIQAGLHPKILVLSRDGSRLYAANWGSHNVTEIDTAAWRVVRTHEAGTNPRGTAVTTGGTLYVANFNGHSIDVYAGPDRTAHHRLSNVCFVPRHLCLSPDERTLYITCFRHSELLAMDVATEAVTHRVSVGNWPKACDVTPDGRYVGTANYGGSSVSVVDTTDWTASTLDVPAMDHGSGIVAARDGLRFFATGWYDDHLFAVGPAGPGPGYTVTDRIRQLTLRRRELHRRAAAQ